MTVRVLLFGPYAEAVGAASLEIELSSDPTPTAGDVLSAAVESAPALARLAPVTRVAVNSRFVPADQRVSPGDELALIGLVGGG